MSATRHENSRLPPKYQEPSKTKRTALNLTLTPSPDFRKRKENSFLGSSNRISAVGCSTCSPVRGGNIRVLLCSSWAGIFTRFLFHTPPKRNQNNKRKTYREIYGAKGVNKCYYYSAIANLGIRGITENVRAGESPAYLSSPHVGHSVA